MRSIRTALAALLAFLVEILAACSDTTTSIMPPPPPPTPQTITVAFCDFNVPIWVAFQDGDGAWTRAQPIVSPGKTEFTHTFTAGRGAVARLIQGGPGLTSLVVLYGTPEELVTTSIYSPKFCGSPSKTLRGTVVGIDSTDFVRVQLGFIAEVLIPGSASFDLNFVQPGPRDILATRFTRTNGVNVLSKIMLRHGIDLPDGATIPVFDFNAAEAFPPVTAHVTLVGTDSAFVSTGLETSSFLNTFAFPPPSEPGPVQPYFAIPEQQLADGDLQILRATIHNDDLNGVRSAALYFHAPTDRELTLGPQPIAPTFTTVATSPSLRLRAHFVEQQAYDRAVAITYQEDSTRQVTIIQTAAYGRSDLVIPDLSGVNGFLARWALTPTALLGWIANRIGGTAGLGVDPVVVDGSVQRSAVTSGTVAP